MQELQRVLYAEDDPDIQLVAKLALETVGRLQVQLCASGVEVLAAVQSFAPDLILLDVMMPVMDGPMALQQLREHGITQPVVFMTAKAQPSEIKEFLRLGAYQVVAKPFDPMLLAQQLRQIWHDWQHQAHVCTGTHSHG